MIHRRTRILALGMIAALVTGIFTGCGEEKTIDYTIEGMSEEEQPQSAGGKSGLAQFEGEEVWKENWMAKVDEYENNGQMIDIETEVRADAKIILPQAKQMSVVEVLEPEFNADYKEMVAGNIFDSGEIYYGNAAHLPKEDLEMLHSYYERSVIILAGEPYDYEEWTNGWLEYLDAWDEIENAKDTYTPVDGYTVNKYIGVCEGRMYKLTFAEDSGDTDYFRRLKQIVLEPKDLYEVCPAKFKEQEALVYSPWIFGDWIENHCEISEEDALKEAKRFAEKLGLDYAVYSFSRPLLWGNAPETISITGVEESDTWGVNGYVFYFDLGVDDISFVQFGMEEDYSNFWTQSDRKEEIQYSLQSQLQIYVTDEGVIKVVANNPVKITGVSESVELLPLSTIKGIMKEAMHEQWETLRLNAYTPMDMNEMELIYFRVRDEENPGKYSYVPTWRLGTVMREEFAHTISIQHQVLINAIDGTVIDFYDET